MARKNPKRRLLAKLKAWDMQAHSLTVAANMEPLQSGPVRSALSKFDNKVGSLRAPKETWEGTGKAGKVVRGKFVATRKGARQRFAKS